MTDQIVLTLPEDISELARRIAATTAQPVEQVLLDHLKTLTIPLPNLPSDIQAELDKPPQVVDSELGQYSD